MPIYLDVPFRDKDIVKALGARWDGTRRAWFAPDSAPPGRFDRWAKKEGAAAPEETSERGPGKESPAEPGEKKSVSLSSLLFEASEAVRRALPSPRWCIAEIASCRTNASGHTYIEVVEHDGSGREVAKANARIWAGSSRMLKTFEKLTGEPLSSGMKILFLAQAEFSVQYGFGLTIQDLDPSWTLGEMERKIREIRMALQEEGLYGRNRGIGRARDFERVLLLAPDGAAGLGDFETEIEALERLGLCEFERIHAVFEGAGALASLSKALDAIASRDLGAFDALAIIRGGGAKTSLNWLNEIELARRVCLLPIPVLTGIGHERDSTILDEVSNESFDTPSKVAAGIVSRIAQNAMRAEEAMREIERVATMAVQASENDCDRQMGEIVRLAESAAAQAEKDADRAMAEVASQARRIVDESDAKTDFLGREILGLGPGGALRRGYAIVKSEGKAVVSAKKAEKASGSLEICFADGTIEAKAIGKAKKATYGSEIGRGFESETEGRKPRKGKGNK